MNLLFYIISFASFASILYIIVFIVHDTCVCVCSISCRKYTHFAIKTLANFTSMFCHFTF